MPGKSKRNADRVKAVGSCSGVGKQAVVLDRVVRVRVTEVRSSRGLKVMTHEQVYGKACSNDGK